MARPLTFNKAKVLDLAMRQFWKKGYEATSLADLLRATGLSKSSLYATFGDKRKLFLAAFDAYRAARWAEMRQIAQRATGREVIRAFFEMIVADGMEGDGSGCMSINEAVEMAPHDSDVRERVLSDLQLIEAELTTAVKRGQADGSIKSRKSASDLGRILMLAFPGVLVMIRAGFGRSTLDDRLVSLMAGLD